MSNIDKQALRDIAAAAKSTPLWHAVGVFGEVVDPAKPEWKPVHDFCKKFTAERVLALLDELEAADALNKHLELAIRKAEGCSEALRRKAEAAEKRISELEAREVNLPKLSVGEVMHMSGFSRDYAEGWCSGNDNAIHEIHAAGVKVAAAASKGE
ncbi:TPA: ead/Ea22-like family protein [Enterobacter hormaechei subsp. steigerwaltii]|nr:ead/Ea22-like family protein [Enterobacter hormaechei subsp. steigerwaltii]